MKDGSVYEGMFLTGMKHGYGIYYSMDGVIYEGNWEFDKQ